MQKIWTIAGAVVVLASILAASLYYSNARKPLPEPMQPLEQIQPSEGMDVETSAPAMVQEPALPAGSFSIQIAAFRDLDRAQGMARKLKAAEQDAYVLTEDAAGKPLYKVVIGRYATRQDALLALPKLRDQYHDCFIKAPAA